MGFLRWIIGGLAGGAVGIVIWVAVGYFTQLEVDWVVAFAGWVLFRRGLCIAGKNTVFAKPATIWRNFWPEWFAHSAWLCRGRHFARLTRSKFAKGRTMNGLGFNSRAASIATRQLRLVL